MEDVPTAVFIIALQTSTRVITEQFEMVQKNKLVIEKYRRTQVEIF